MFAMDSFNQSTIPRFVPLCDWEFHLTFSDAIYHLKKILPTLWGKPLAPALPKNIPTLMEQSLDLAPSE